MLRVMAQPEPAPPRVAGTRRDATRLCMRGPPAERAP